MGGRKETGRRPAVEVGAHVVYQGQTLQVAALQGQRVCLLGEDGADMSLLLGRLFADPGFEVVGARAAGAVLQWGCSRRCRRRRSNVHWRGCLTFGRWKRGGRILRAAVRGRRCARSTTPSGGRWRSGRLSKRER